MNAEAGRGLPAVYPAQEEAAMAGAAVDAATAGTAQARPVAVKPLVVV